MRVALINNMNNMLFAMTRYLRDADVDAHLYVMPDGIAHFAPQCDTFQDLSTLDWVHTFPTGESLRDFWEQSGADYDELRGYDVLVGCGTVTAMLARKGLPVDVLIPYGQEILHDSKGTWDLRRPLVSMVAQWRALWQRRAFRRARFVVVNESHTIYGDAVRRIGINAVGLPIPAVYNREEMGLGDWAFLREHDFVVFYHGRQMWASNPDNLPNFEKYGGNKRNDQVIRAFARFTRQTGFRSPLLVMFEYGPDVQASKDLIQREGIAHMVCWRPLAPRKVIMQGLRLSNLATEHFRPGGCGLGGTGLEAMAYGVPLLTHTNGARDIPGHYLQGIPLLDVLTVEDILGVFTDYEANPRRYRELGQAARQWFDDNLGAGIIPRYVAMFEEVLAEKQRLGKLVTSQAREGARVQSPPLPGTPAPKKCGCGTAGSHE